MSIIKYILCPLFNYYLSPIGQNLSVCVPWFQTTVTAVISIHCKYQTSAVSMPNSEYLHIIIIIIIIIIKITY
jgi:hypothetical protein